MGLSDFQIWSESYFYNLRTNKSENPRNPRNYDTKSWNVENYFDTQIKFKLLDVVYNAHN